MLPPHEEREAAEHLLLRHRQLVGENRADAIGVLVVRHER
jgi:hypothetical protein